MGKKMDKAFEAMRESNRLYLEDMKKKETAENEGEDEAPLTPEQQAELDAAREKAKAFRDEEDPADLAEAEKRAEEFHRDEDKMPLEKGDIPAMILSALMVFGPIFLILLGILLLAMIFLH